MKRVALMMVAVGVILAADKPKADDGKSLQGSWVMVSGEVDGMKIPEADVKSATLTITGDKHEVHVGKQTWKGTQKLDAAKTPKEIDSTDDAGGGKTVTIQGIYELSGDTFKVCFNTTGKGRPKKFEAGAGSGNLLHVWKRKK